MEQFAPHLDLQRTFEVCPPGTWRSREPTLRRGATHRDLVCRGFSAALAPCFPAGNRLVRGPAVEICTVRTRSVALFPPFSVTSSNIGPQEQVQLRVSSATSFFSIIAMDLFFSADCKACGHVGTRELRRTLQLCDANCLKPLITLS